MILTLRPEQAEKIYQEFSRFKNTVNFAGHYFSIDQIETWTDDSPNPLVHVRFVCDECLECKVQGKICKSDDVMLDYISKFLD